MTVEMQSDVPLVEEQLFERVRSAVPAAERLQSLQPMQIQTHYGLYYRQPKLSESVGTIRQLTRSMEGNA